MSSVAFAGRGDTACLEQPQCSFADVRELVGHDWIETLFGEAELHEASLRRLEVVIAGQLGKGGMIIMATHVSLGREPDVHLDLGGWL